MCVCGDLHSNYVHMNLSMSVYMCNICMYVCMFLMCTWLCISLQTLVCVCVCMCVCLRVCILSPVSKSETDQFGVLVMLLACNGEAFVSNIFINTIKNE